MSKPTIQYRSTAFTSKPTGQPRVRYPLPQSSPIQFAAYAFDQDLSIISTGFPAAPRNTPASSATFGITAFTPPSASQSSTNAILTSVSQPQDEGAALLKYTGSFAIVPASWDDFETQVVPFPAWLNYIYGTNYRDAKPTEVHVRLRYDYFVIDPANLATGLKDSGGTAIVRVADKSRIPILRRTPFLATAAGVANVNQEATSIVPAGGIAGTGGFYPPTLPTLEQYRSWCAVATTFYASLAAGSATWDNTHPSIWDGVSTSDTTSGQWRFANSKLVDYAGNIVSRVTAYALVE